MKKIINTAVAVSVGAAAGYAAKYGLCVLADELLFNRNKVLPKKYVTSIADCDSSHLGDVLVDNLKWVEKYGYERHYLITDRGEKLTGFLLRAEKESDIYVFGAHGYRSYGKKEFAAVTQHYIKKGFNVFFPDHVASGESEGTYCTFSHYETIDCLKWLDYMLDTFGKDIKIILHGVSMGAATVMRMTGSGLLPENVKMTIEDCGFTTAVDLFRFKLEGLGIKSDRPIRAVNKVNKKRLGFDFYELNPVESVKKATIPMMFIHGDSDGLVPSFMVHELYDACASEEKKILKIDGADHAQSLMVGGEEYFNALDEFVDKNI